LPPGQRLPERACASLVVRDGFFGRVVSSEDVPMTSNALAEVYRRDFGFM